MQDAARWLRFLAQSVVVGLAAFPEDEDCAEGDWCQLDQEMGKMGYAIAEAAAAGVVAAGVAPTTAAATTSKTGASRFLWR